MPRVWTLPELLAIRSRGELRAAGEWLDGPGVELRGLLCERARSAGVEVPEELPGKKLLRLARGRSADAQRVRSPIQRDDPFTCLACGRDVPPGGRRPRDHCPWCLWSAHVDVIPGDRASGCGGLLRPVGAELIGGVTDLLYRCERCGAARRNRLLDDVDPPDDPSVLYRLLDGVGRGAGLA